MKKPLFRAVVMLVFMTSSSSLIAAEEQGFVVVDFEQFEDTTVCPTYYSDRGAHFSSAILRTGSGWIANSTKILEDVQPIFSNTWCASSPFVITFDEPVSHLSLALYTPNSELHLRDDRGWTQVVFTASGTASVEVPSTGVRRLEISDPCNYWNATGCDNVWAFAIDNVRFRADRPCLAINGDGSVEPSTQDKEQLTSVVVEVTDCEGNPQADIEVETTVVAVDGTGGHTRFHLFPRPPGGLRDSGSSDPISESIVRMSDTSGQIQMQFLPPEVAGRHAITASCVAIECFAPDVPLSVEVKVDGLAAISPLPTFYTLTEYLQQPIGQNIGDNTKHDGENHHLTPEATGILMQVAFYYAAEHAAIWGQFPEKLHVNDASLPSGGLFDYSGTWVYVKGTSHFEHRRGTVVDIRANELLGAVPPSPDADRMFMRAAATAGAQATREYAKRVPRHPNEHYHLRLRGARE